MSHVSRRLLLSSFSVGLVLAVGFALGQSVSGSAARTVVATRPIITAIWASPANITAVGGRVTVRVTARYSTTCIFSGVGLNTLKLPCSSQRAAESINFPPNRLPSPHPWTVYVISKGPGGTSRWSHITVTQDAAASTASTTTTATTTPTTTTTTTTPPAVPTATLIATPMSLPSTGGLAVITFTSTNASSCTLGSAPTLWAGTNPAAVNCNGIYTVTVGSTTTERQWTLTFTATNSTGQTTTATATVNQQAPPAAPITQTPIWSGYVVPSTSIVTHASGSWVVPALNCAATPNAGAAVWVGIGGYGTSGPLLQTGTTSECVNGVQQNHGWFEEVPSDPNFSKTFLNFPVTAGDSIQSAVYQGSTGQWETRLDDLSTGLAGIMVTGGGWGVAPDTATNFPLQGLTTGLSYAGGYTAEWIVEAYTQYNAVVSLANYGTVTFSNLQTSLASWSLTQSEEVALNQNGSIVSTPSPPSNGGFSVSYTG